MLGDIQVEKEYLCLHCREWKLRRAFSVDRHGYYSPDDVKAKCKECQNAYFKEWWKRRGSEMSKKRNTPPTQDEAFAAFMERNRKRMDFGLDPITQMAGVEGRRIGKTAEEAKVAVIKWFADIEYQNSEAGQIEKEIIEIQRKMTYTSHLEVQTRNYNEQLDSLKAKLQELTCKTLT